MSNFPDGSNGTLRSSLLQGLLLFGQIQQAWIRKVQRIRPNGFSRFRRFACAGFSINQIQDLLCGFIDPWAARLLERAKRIRTNCCCTKSSTKRRSNFPLVDHKNASRPFVHGSFQVFPEYPPQKPDESATWFPVYCAGFRARFAHNPELLNVLDLENKPSG